MLVTSLQCAVTREYLILYLWLSHLLYDRQAMYTNMLQTANHSSLYQRSPYTSIYTAQRCPTTWLAGLSQSTYRVESVTLSHASSKNARLESDGRHASITLINNTAAVLQKHIQTETTLND